MIIEKWAMGEKAIRFFTVAARLLGADANSRATRMEFWNQVAFYNYVQGIVGNSARQRPTEAQWSSARAPFTDVLDELKPEVVVVLGRELWNHLPQGERLALGRIDGRALEGRSWATPKGHSTVLGMTNHPSWPGFSYKKWRPQVDLLFAAVPVPSNSSAGA